ncbi:gluconate 2-dehydrogenase subunit 3 family protein [Pseudomonas typographi]|uniref:Gluconate 2-dehydrogenase subunit 3 family protein n=1 Tax=Pseudomonas typographi TaxID=2715964 RepID=A0ABR7Z9X7_9PSED|nr:gluconate 2-dehydrogenase subunit 3 family protein [Pseudomonas typographi]MBD1551101.1 gluconate 2-dehydrogenase subunit 3 family protein [Pseudomonas typographi]MBD1586405.1 gluconate 2-dehydrogenase subunit 3 family protein [Pseudomonas typographi]MBD1602222.1 gluconate 2-dehydrogenase subunit 3 family protein [Pseudomonas typographi]
MNRRDALISLVQLTALSVAGSAGASVISARTPMPVGTQPEALPKPPRKGGLAYLAADEAREVAAIYDRLIPQDELGMSASQAGCVEFIDRELAGAFGQAASVYRLGPIVPGTAEQGPQFTQTPAERYRSGLGALAGYCQAHYGKPFSALDGDTQDSLLRAMENGTLHLPAINAAAFFALLLQNVREGYLADPMYGGNRDMVGWKLIGFPGARYDYRPYLDKKGMALNLEPVSLLDGAG